MLVGRPVKLLSTAVLRGGDGEEAPLAVGDYVDENGRYSALGGAAVAVTFAPLNVEAPVDQLDELRDRFPELRRAARCPICELDLTLEEVVELHLNDGACSGEPVPRGAIAAWLIKWARDRREA